MNIIHRGAQPKIHESAYVAPTAVLAGDVTIGAESSIGFGCVILAEGALIEIGSQIVVRENVVIRAVTGHPVRIGNNVLIGPGSALNGCTIEDEVFLATRVTVFHDAIIKRQAEVRINGIVQDRIAYRLYSRPAPDQDLRQFMSDHIAEAVQSRLPDVDRIGNSGTNVLAREARRDLGGVAAAEFPDSRIRRRARTRWSCGYARDHPSRCAICAAASVRYADVSGSAVTPCV